MDDGKEMNANNGCGRKRKPCSHDTLSGVHVACSGHGVHSSGMNGIKGGAGHGCSSTPGVGRYRDVRLSLLQASMAAFLVRNLSRMSFVLIPVSQYPNAADWALYGPTIT